MYFSQKFKANVYRGGAIIASFISYLSNQHWFRSRLTVYMCQAHVHGRLYLVRLITVVVVRF